MREIVSPLSGIRSPFGQRREVSLLALYAANGLNPSLVIDAKTPRYFLDGVQSDLVSVTDHSRASGATYLDSSGTLQTAASGEIRDQAYAYVDGVLTGPYVLTEPDAVNLITDSFTFSEWTAQFASKTSNTVETTDPAGTQTALKLESTSAAAGSGIYRSRIPVTAGNSFSVYAKIGIGRWVGLSNEGNAIGWAYFDLVDGVVGNFNSCEPFIESVGNGWYRIGLNNSQYSSALGTFCLISLESANGTVIPWNTVNSVAGDVVYLWGAQLEQAPIATSYIPTSGSQGARAEDVLTIPDAPWPSGDPGSRAIGISMKGLMTGENSIFAAWTLDANNGIQIASGASDFTFTQEAASVVDSVTGGSYTSGINVPFSIASYHKDNGINGAVDGVALTENTTPTILPDLSTTPIQIRPSGGPLYLEEMRIWVESAVDKITGTLIEEASA